MLVGMTATNTPQDSKLRFQHSSWHEAASMLGSEHHADSGWMGTMQEPQDADGTATAMMAGTWQGSFQLVRQITQEATQLLGSASASSLSLSDGMLSTAILEMLQAGSTLPDLWPDASRESEDLDAWARRATTDTGAQADLPPADLEAARGSDAGQQVRWPGSDLRVCMQTQGLLAQPCHCQVTV